MIVDVRLIAPERDRNGNSLTANRIFFNHDDPIANESYLQSVTIEYVEGHLPRSNTPIWLYSIVSSSNKFIVCTRILLATSQISTQDTKQTYTVRQGAIALRDGSFIAIGVEDANAQIVATNGGNLVYLDMNEQSTSLSRYEPTPFQVTDDNVGAHLQYTLWM
jgi:hypothetical protein